MLSRAQRPCQCSAMQVRVGNEAWCPRCIMGRALQPHAHSPAHTRWRCAPSSEHTRAAALAGGPLHLAKAVAVCAGRAGRERRQRVQRAPQVLRFCLRAQHRGRVGLGIGCSAGNQAPAHRSPCMPVFTAQVSMRSPALCARAVLRCDSLAGTGPVQRRQERRGRHVSHRVHARGQPRAAHGWLLTRRPVPAYVCAPCSMCAQRGHLSYPARMGVAQPAMLVNDAAIDAGQPQLSTCAVWGAPWPMQRAWSAAVDVRAAAGALGSAARRSGAASPQCRATSRATKCSSVWSLRGRAPKPSPARSQLHSESHEA